MIGADAGIGELRTRFDLPRQEIDHVLYGTTIVTNAVPEHGAAVTGTVWRSVGRAGV
jgi:N-methylhydantoinase A/oxoprolinase/acetone carboxylase beta subunit